MLVGAKGKPLPVVTVDSRWCETIFQLKLIDCLTTQTYKDDQKRFFAVTMKSSV